MDIFLIIIGCTLLSLGILEASRIFVLRAFKLKNDAKIAITVEPESADDCEYIIRAVTQWLKWAHAPDNVKIVCINRNGDKETEKICQCFSDEQFTLRVFRGNDLMYNIFEQEFELPERGQIQRG